MWYIGEGVLHCPGFFAEDAKWFISHSGGVDKVKLTFVANTNALKNSYFSLEWQDQDTYKIKYASGRFYGSKGSILYDRGQILCYFEVE